MSRYATLLALAAALAACAPQRFVCPSRGGRQWVEVRSAHFLLRTDVEDPAQLVRDLEAAHEAVTSLVPKRPADGAYGPILAVAFRAREDYLAFAPSGSAAYFHSTAIGEPEIVLAADGNARQRLAVGHEIARVILSRAMPLQPVWFGEGAAADRAERVEAYRRQLAAAEDPIGAFRQLFPEWDPARPEALDALDAALGAFLARRATARPGEPLPEVAFTSQPMASARVHDLRLSLPRGGARPEAFRAARLDDADEALEEDPASPVALILVAQERGGDRAAAARRATEAHPEAGIGWAVLAETLPEGTAEKEAVLRRAVEAAPSASLPRNNLARTLLRRGRPTEALALAEGAVAMSPWIPSGLDNYAVVLQAVGRCPEALDAQRRVLALVTSRGTEADRRAFYADRLTRLEASCGKAAAAVSSAGVPAAPAGPADAKGPPPAAVTGGGAKQQ